MLICCCLFKVLDIPSGLTMLLFSISLTTITSFTFLLKAHWKPDETCCSRMKLDFYGESIGKHTIYTMDPIGFKHPCWLFIVGPYFSRKGSSPRKGDTQHIQAYCCDEPPF